MLKIFPVPVLEMVASISPALVCVNPATVNVPPFSTTLAGLLKAPESWRLPAVIVSVPLFVTVEALNEPPANSSTPAAMVV